MNHIVKSENMSKSHDGGDSFQIADCRFRCAEESIEDNNSTTQSRVCQSQVMLFRHLETLREYTQHAETKTKRKRAPNPNTRYMNMYVVPYFMYTHLKRDTTLCIALSPSIQRRCMCLIECYL